MLRAQTILIGVDGSESSSRALERAAGLTVYGTRLIVAHVAPRQRELARGQTVLDRADSILTQQHVLFEKRQLVGDPRSSLLDLATSAGVDLIIVGNGKTTLQRMLSGSVSTYIVHHAPCDVMVVRK